MMEWWNPGALGNAVKNIFPIFQYSSYDNVFVALRFALCALPSRRSAAADKNPTSRLLSEHPLSPSGSVSARLRDLGYIEEKNMAFEFRASGGKPERNVELAADLVRLKVDVIVAEGAGAIRAAKDATSTIPIMMSEVNDPIALGFVASLAHPSGNITGISNLSPELSGKRLELITEVIPKVSRVALLAYRGVDAHEHRRDAIGCSVVAFATSVT
jgi:ABC-type uncharacterized transport system substrate-binding protein